MPPCLCAEASLSTRDNTSSKYSKKTPPDASDGATARPRPSRAFSGRAILDFGQPQSWFRRMQPSATLARCVRPFTWTCLGPRCWVMTPAIASHPALGWRVVPFFVGFRHGRPFVGMAPYSPHVASTSQPPVTRMPASECACAADSISARVSCPSVRHSSLGKACGLSPSARQAPS